MNYDAQEAALGLLSLSPSTTFIQPVPLVTSNPLKRKQHPQTNHQPPQRPNPSKGRSKQSIIAEREKEKQKSKEDVEGEVGDVSSESIRCICGSTFDDGFSIACDDCSRWCHAACFDIAEGSVPEQWSCWVCVPRPVDRDRAAKLQRSRQRAMEDAERERLTLLSQPQQQRRTSPGVERKHRRVSAPAIEGSKKRRRMSTISTQPPTIATQPSNSHPSTGEDTPVDICTDADEPKSHYVHITEDIVVSSSTTAKLRQQAQNWRGITALTPYPPPPSSTPTTLQPLPTEPTSVRPPSYALHTTSPVPSNTLLAPFPSTITPSAAYLSDPLNGYAHLGMPKPHVHLMGPPLDLALDARVTGNEARFVRSGCWPNAVLRPVLCKKSREDERRKEKAWKDTRQNSDGAGDKEPQGKAERNQGDEQTTLAFAVFALRDLKANEEVVLGWEWDDGNAVHELPALLQTPNMFPPAHVRHLRSQLSNILHALGSTFTTCACGERAKGCAIREMEAFVEGERPLSGEATKRGRIPVRAETVEGEHVWMNGNSMEWEQGGREQVHSGSSHPHPQHRRAQEQQQRQRYHHRHATLHDTSVNVAGPSTLRPPSPPPRPMDLGPLLGAERGFRTREKVAWAGGMGGVEMVGGSKEDNKQTRPRPSRPRSSQAVSRMGPNVSRMALGDEVTETWDEEGDVDVEGEEEKGRGRVLGEEDDVNIDEDVDVEMDGYDDFSTNRATRPALKTQDSQRKPNAGVFRLRAEDGGPQRVRIIVPGEGVGWDSGGEYNLGPDWGKDESREEVEEDLEEEDDAVESEVEERKMPPKMRKRWIHQELEVLRETYGIASGSGSRSGSRSRAGSEVAPGEREGLSPAIGGVSGLVGGDPEERGVEETRAERSVEEMKMDVDINAQEMPPPPPPPVVLTPTPSPVPSPLEVKYKAIPPTSPSNSPESPSVGAAALTPPAASPSISFSRLSLVSPVVSSLLTTTQAVSPQILGSDVQPHTRLPPLGTSSGLMASLQTYDRIENEQAKIIVEKTKVQTPSLQSSSQSPPSPPLVTEENALSSPLTSPPPEPKTTTGSTITEGPIPVAHIYNPSPHQSDERLNIQFETQFEPRVVDDSPHAIDEISSPSGIAALDINASPREAVLEENREHSPPPLSPELHAIIPHTVLRDSPESPPPQHSPSPTPPPHITIVPPRLQTPPHLPSPPPPPPPKVKMSLKDFAARKRKQREEKESVGSGSMEASPMVAETSLAPDIEGGARPDILEPTKHDHTPEPPKTTPVVIEVEVRKETEEPLGKPAGREALDVVTNGQIKDEDIEMSVDASENSTVTPAPPATERGPPTIPLSPTPSTPHTTDNPAVSLQAKMELLDQTIPEQRTTSPRPSLEVAPPPPIVRRPAQLPSHSHEEGEIPANQDEKQSVAPRPQPPPVRTSFVPPHSHTPPTQPRSFQTPPGYSPPPRNHPPYRTPLTTPPPTTVPPSSRPLPSGPRALRMASQSYQPARPASRSFSGPQAPPRGPSADRDRMDWDRDRSWQPRARTRGGGWAR